MPLKTFCVPSWLSPEDNGMGQRDRVRNLETVDQIEREIQKEQERGKRKKPREGERERERVTGRETQTQ